MSVTAETILFLIWLHTICDFFLQTDRMAKTKSSSMKWLSIHVGVYSFPFLLLFGWKFAVITFCLHWLTDLVTSRITKRLWAAGEVHWFFAVIGVDQAIHFTSLILAAELLL